MSVGDNIRKYREEAGLTQKGLADQLYVTPQAVSRWEKGEVEPSVDTLRSISDIFTVTLDQLIKGRSDSPTPKAEETPSVEAQNEASKAEVVAAPKENKLLGVCIRCGKAIYDDGSFWRGYKNVTYTGRGHHHEHVNYTLTDLNHGDGYLCASCGEELKEETHREKMAVEAQHIRQKHSAMGWAIFAGIIAFIVMILVGSFTVKNNVGGGVTAFCLSPLVAYAMFSFVYVMIANNTFVSEVFIDIASFGFVKMPGVLFTFDADGIVALVVIKAVLGILSFLIFFGFLVLAVAVCSIFTMFAFPISYHSDPA